LKIVITTKGFNVILCISVLTLASIFFLNSPLKLWVVYGSLSAVLLSFYMRRDSGYNKVLGKTDYGVNIAVAALVYGAIGYYNESDMTFILNAILFSGGLVVLSYVLNAYQTSNKAANTQECYKVKEWDVYSDKQTEVVTATSGGIAAETMNINRVATNVTHDEAMRLLDTIPTIKGNQPHPISSKSCGGFYPKIDRNGKFIGFHFNQEDEHLPFKA
jgi:hypothetical protein